MECEMKFSFKQFDIDQSGAAMKVGTDGVLLGAWANLPEGRCGVVDVGCGTGLIALMVAQRNPQAEVVAVEIEPAAAAEARHNVEASRWADRVRVVEADVVDWSSGCGERFDVMISNPPFFAHSLHSPVEERNLARHTDSLTHGQLVEVAAQLLTERGRLAVVLPAECERGFRMCAVAAGLHPHRICEVVTSLRKSPKRVLMEFGRERCEEQRERLVMMVGDEHTPEYRALVADFYLKY